MSITRRIKDRGLYFSLVFAFLVPAVSLLVLYPSGRSFFIINGMHAGVLDASFTYLTHIGDGITAAVIALLLVLFYQVGAGIMALLGIALCGLTVWISKSFLFTGSPRPKLFFWQNKMVHYIDGIQTHIEHSFPSGHSLTAFFIFTFLAMLSFTRGMGWQVALALLAIIAAYSRVYLAQHFVGDIVAGACIGTLYGLLIYMAYLKTRHVKFFQKKLIR